jgi:hypothetical protein
MSLEYQRLRRSQRQRPHLRRRQLPQLLRRQPSRALRAKLRLHQAFCPRWYAYTFFVRYYQFADETQTTGTTTQSTKTQTITTLPVPSTTGCPVPLYYQCGGSQDGKAWTGCTKCVTGATCVQQNGMSRSYLDFPKTSKSSSSNYPY